VIGIKHELKGQAMVAFVTLVEGVQFDQPTLEKELIALVAKDIGKFAKPEKIILSNDLPKTRSGKIMRRLLRDIADGSVMGNVTTLADPAVLESLKAKYEES